MTLIDKGDGKPTGSAASLFYSPNEKPFGLSYNDWILKWWRWFYSAPKEEADQNEDYPNEDKEVRFLTTVHNFEPDMYVNTVVKDNQAILFSVAKWISLGLPFMKDEDLTSAAVERIDTLETMRLTIDGTQIQPHRIRTDVFPLELKREVHNPKVIYSPIRTLRKGKYKAVGDGFWLFIKPFALQKGQQHKIDTFCSCATGVVTINVHHSIEVK